MAMQFYESALKLSTSCGDLNEQSATFMEIASLKWTTGDYYTAQLHAREAQGLSKLSANLYEEARGLRIEAMCSMMLGHYQGCISQLNRAKEIVGICGMLGGSLDYSITSIQVEVHLLKSEYAQARSMYMQTVDNTAGQNARAYAYGLLNVAQIDIVIGGAAEEVYQNLHKAQEIFSSLHCSSEIIFCEMSKADLELREQQFDKAKWKLQDCLSSDSGREGQARSFCLERLANTKAWQATESQSNWPLIYLGYAQKSKEKLALYKALLFIGDVFILNKDEDTAHNLYTVALDGFTYMDVHHSRAQCMLRLGDLANRRGEILKAIELWKTAQPLFRQSLQVKDVAEIDTRLTAIEKSHQAALYHLATLQAPIQLLQELSISTEVGSDIDEVGDPNAENTEDKALVAT
jgi:tetratricopeptide (TPR) repeat protein